MYSKIEILLITGTSINKIEFLKSTYEYRGNFLIIATPNPDDYTVVYTIYNLDDIKSFKTSRD